jgi:hypothetical protein
MTPTTVAEAPEMFQRAVDSLAVRPNFMAHVFFTAFAGDVSAKRISAELGCSETNALRLAMMSVPRSGRPHFREDVARIAAAGDADPEQLLSVIKQAQALAVFDPVGKEHGMLLAARDVVSEPEDRED